MICFFTRTHTEHCSTPEQWLWKDKSYTITAVFEKYYTHAAEICQLVHKYREYMLKEISSTEHPLGI